MSLRAALLALLLCSLGAQADTLLTFRQIIDGTGERLPERQILLSGNRIRAVGNDLEQQYPEAEAVDLSTLTALPGIVDVHVHLTYGLRDGAHGRAWDELFASPPQDRLVAAVRNAALTLDSGVTTVRDLFAFDGLDRQLGALIDAGIVPGPRMFSAGRGLHPLTVPDAAHADLPAFFAGHAQARAAEGGGWVKVFATSGTADDLSDTQQYFYPELKALTDTAHQLGLRVAVHSYGPSAVGDALRAGVDSIEHPVGLSDELLDAWAGTRTWYVPTIDHNRYYAQHSEEYGYGDTVVRELEDFIRANISTLKRAYARGIRIALGSDAVMSMFGQNTREIRWFVEAGIPAADVLRMATLNGAELLGQADRLGRLQAGYLADIIAVAGDPLSDPTVIVSGLKLVIKDGRIEVDRR